MHAKDPEQQKNFIKNFFPPVQSAIPESKGDRKTNITKAKAVIQLIKAVFLNEYPKKVI